MTELLAQALVIEVGARSVQVHVEGRGGLRCTVTGNLFKRHTDETRPLAVGDHVTVRLPAEDEDGDGVVLGVAERTNRLARRAAGGRAHAGRGVHAHTDYGGATTRRQSARRGRRIRRSRREDSGSGRGRLTGPETRADSPEAAWERDAEKRGQRGGMGGGRGGAGTRAQPRVQVLASNIDRLMVVASLDDPPFRPGLVDRFLVAADMEGIDAVLCLNKMDLAEPDLGLDASVADVYVEAGVTVLPTSIVTGQGIDELAQLMSEGVSLLMGHSGVGKSSLLNAISPGLSLRVGDVAEHHGRGRHTTTQAVLLPLDAGGWVVDSPGIREFVLEGVSATELARLYPGFEELPDGCRFNDCLHQEEPGCAVTAAIAEETLDPERYEAYLRVLEDLAS